MVKWLAAERRWIRTTTSDAFAVPGTSLLPMTGSVSLVAARAGHECIAVEDGGGPPTAIRSTHPGLRISARAPAVFAHAPGPNP
jgi:hypothetical protein